MISAATFILLASLRRPESPRNIPDPTVRVGLIRALGHPGSLTVRAPEGARLTDPLDSTLGRGPAEWRFIVNENGVAALSAEGSVKVAGPALRVESGQENLQIVSMGVRRRTYRGALEIRLNPDGAGLLIVNELTLESYLRGVIAAEMPSTAGLEALKAQTVAARSYAIRNLGRYAARGYDLSDDVDCQTYGGVESERASTDQAVSETAGQVLTRNGMLLLCDYYDDCGGATSAGEREGDYPPSVRDGPEGGGPDFCARGTYHTWTLTLAPDEISRAIDSRVSERVGSITGIQITQVDSSGRARKIVIQGEKGEKEMTGSAFRGVIGYSRLKSTLFTVATDASGRLVFSGRGYGHGHGLCQWGAMGMAAEPYRKSCAEILEHYYPGGVIAQLSQNILAPARASLPSRGGGDRRLKSGSGRKGR